MLIFPDPNLLKKDLLKLKDRVINFNTFLDFSVCNKYSHIIATETEYADILHQLASELNNKPLRLYASKEGGHMDSFVSLVVSVKDKEQLKFSHGGTEVIHVLLKGKFRVEVRNYAGPSIEINIRESSN